MSARSHTSPRRMMDASTSLIVVPHLYANAYALVLTLSIFVQRNRTVVSQPSLRIVEGILKCSKEYRRKIRSIAVEKGEKGLNQIANLKHRANSATIP